MFPWQRQEKNCWLSKCNTSLPIERNVYIILPDMVKLISRVLFNWQILVKAWDRSYMEARFSFFHNSFFLDDIFLLETWWKYWQRLKCLAKNLTQCLFCPPYFTRRLPWDWNRVSAVRSRLLNGYACFSTLLMLLCDFEFIALKLKKKSLFSVIN